jgi:hypothetical protein
MSKLLVMRLSEKECTTHLKMSSNNNDLPMDHVIKTIMIVLSSNNSSILIS